MAEPGSRHSNNVAYEIPNILTNGLDKCQGVIQGLLEGDNPGRECQAAGFHSGARPDSALQGEFPQAPRDFPRDDLYRFVSGQEQGLTDQLWYWNCELETLLACPDPTGAFWRPLFRKLHLEEAR